MKNLSFTVIFSIFCLNFIHAQVDIKFNNSNFPNQKTELTLAKKQIKTADILAFTENKFEEALNYYKKAYDFNPDNSELNFKVGLCYYNTIQKQECLKYFEKAYLLNPKVDKKIDFYLGRGYHFNYEFDKAIKHYNNYLAMVKDENEIKDITKMITECRYGKELLKDTVKVEIINLGANVNSEYREYGPTVTADGHKIYFTSRRKGTTGNSIAADGMYYEDIYETQKTDNGWTKARNVGSPLNTKLHDAIIGLSPDGQTMFVYMDDNGGDIYVSNLKGSKWLKPISISDKINSKYHESSACISSDNKTLYFISDNPELSIGGRDVFYSTLQSNGQWSDPVNLGRAVNTVYDEVDIFLHPDCKTLYFSSKGHNTIGGLDIFKTVKDDKGNWSTPVNVGYPINSPLDDAFYVMTASGKSAFFSSVRPEGYGLYDLYEIKYLQDEDKSSPTANKFLVTLVKGIVKDKTTEYPLEATIEIIDNSVDEVVATFTSNSYTGEYLVNLPSGKNYGLNVSKEGYLFHSENFNLPDTAEYQEFVIDVLLQRIEVGTTIVLKNIFFDYDKAVLRPESYPELNRIIETLNKNPNLKIEISGHTDNRGGYEYNKILSTERAKTVVEYLISKGIDKSRLTYVGHAYNKPIATNDTEEGRQLNRRVEFKIIEK